MIYQNLLSLSHICNNMDVEESFPLDILHNLLLMLNLQAIDCFLGTEHMSFDRLIDIDYGGTLKMNKVPLFQMLLVFEGIRYMSVHNHSYMLLIPFHQVVNNSWK